MKIQKTTPHRNWLLLTAIFLLTPLISKQLSAQEIIITPPERLSEVEEDNEIVVVKDEKGLPLQIKFICKVSGDVCATFDLKEHNPYKKLRYPIIPATNNYEIYPKYDVSSINLDEFITRFFPDTKRQDKNLDCHIVSTSTSVSAYLTGNNNYVVANYKLQIIGEESLVGMVWYKYVFNKKGEMIFEIRKGKDIYYNSLVTSDGNYMATEYGGPITTHSTCEIVKRRTEGFRIIDMHTGKIILDEPYSGEEIKGIREKHGKILLTYTLKTGNRRELFRFFDVAKNTIYEKKLSFEEYSTLKKILPSGLLLKTERSEQTISFEKDFVKKKLTIKK